MVYCYVSNAATPGGCNAAHWAQLYLCPGLGHCFVMKGVGIFL